MARLLDCELAALPHLDTLAKVLRLVKPDTLETLLAHIIHRLIRMKALDAWPDPTQHRLNGQTAHVPERSQRTQI